MEESRRNVTEGILESLVFWTDCMFPALILTGPSLAHQKEIGPWLRDTAPMSSPGHKTLTVHIHLIYLGCRVTLVHRYLLDGFSLLATPLFIEPSQLLA